MTLRDALGAATDSLHVFSVHTPSGTAGANAMKYCHCILLRLVGTRTGVADGF